MRCCCVCFLIEDSLPSLSTTTVDARPFACQECPETVDSQMMTRPMQSLRLTSLLVRYGLLPQRRLSGLIVVDHFRHATRPSNTSFEVLTRVGADNSLERLTERSVGLVTDRPGNVDKLSVALLE
jgi:hypothetical protein